MWGELDDLGDMFADNPFDATASVIGAPTSASKAAYANPELEVKVNILQTELNLIKEEKDTLETTNRTLTA